MFNQCDLKLLAINPTQIQTMSYTLIPWLNRSAMKGGVGSYPFCSEFWLNVILVAKGGDLRRDDVVHFFVKMFGVY